MQARPLSLYQEMYGLFIYMEAQQEQPVGILPQNFEAVLWFFLSLLPPGKKRDEFGYALLSQKQGYNGTLQIQDESGLEAELYTTQELLAILSPRLDEIGKSKNSKALLVLINYLAAITPVWEQITLQMPSGATLGKHLYAKFKGKIDEIKESLRDEEIQKALQEFGVKHPFVLIELLQPSISGPDKRPIRQREEKELSLPNPKLMKP